MNDLAFADYYRPRYFLLENVRNFVSHSSSRTFRLTPRTLIDMGYQVRLEITRAGWRWMVWVFSGSFWGFECWKPWCSSVQETDFDLGCFPEERLLQWPKPLHVFRSPQLTTNLPGGTKYAVEHDTRGAPYRTVTVQDAISDLPPIRNGADKCTDAHHDSSKAIALFVRDEQEYAHGPVSAFQRQVGERQRS